ncbi:MAG TPA: peroxiredoxin [Polyangiaceae bacterium]
MFQGVQATLSMGTGEIHHSVHSRVPGFAAAAKAAQTWSIRSSPVVVALSVALFGAASVTGCRKPTSTEPTRVVQGLLPVGTKLPDVMGVDQLGKEHQLSSNVGHPTLVYFYPKDGTPGCTKEACAFRDVWKRFEQANVTLYGVSRDDRASHERFAREHNIPFPLIADASGVWATAFGVPDKGGKSARVSFLFDAKGQLSRLYPDVDPGVHANQVLSDVAAMQ